MEIGIHEAKTKLSKLIPAVLSGEEVIITKLGHPLVKIVPVSDFWQDPTHDALSS